MGKPGGDLTDRQKQFAREYVKDLNATQAAVRAGYSPDTARVLGSRCLQEPRIVKLIVESQQARADRLDVGTDRIEQELARIAFFDIGEVFADDGGLLPVPEIPEDARRAVVSLEVTERRGDVGDDTRGPIGQTTKLRAANKLRALELLGKRHGMFIDQVAIVPEEMTEEELAERVQALLERARLRRDAATGE